MIFNTDKMNQNINCNACNKSNGHLLFIGCCEESYVHIWCTKTLTSCCNCGQELNKWVKQYIECINWTKDATLRITTEWITKQRKIHKARIETQLKIDSVLTLTNLKKAWNSIESIKYNEQHYKKKKQILEAKQISLHRKYFQ